MGALFLFTGFRVVEGMLPHKIEAHDVGNYGRTAGNNQSQLVEGEIASDLLLGPNCIIDE